MKSTLHQYVPQVPKEQNKHSETGGCPSVQVTKQVLLRLSIDEFGADNNRQGKFSH
jgi:hypothetical protein